MCSHGRSAREALFRQLVMKSNRLSSGDSKSVALHVAGNRLTQLAPSTLQFRKTRRCRNVPLESFFRRLLLARANQQVDAFDSELVATPHQFFEDHLADEPRATGKKNS